MFVIGLVCWIKSRLRYQVDLERVYYTGWRPRRTHSIVLQREIMKRGWNDLGIPPSLLYGNRSPSVFTNKWNWFWRERLYEWTRPALWLSSVWKSLHRRDEQRATVLCLNRSRHGGYNAGVLIKADSQPGRYQCVAVLWIIARLKKEKKQKKGKDRVEKGKSVEEGNKARKEDVQRVKKRRKKIEEKRGEAEK